MKRVFRAFAVTAFLIASAAGFVHAQSVDVSTTDDAIQTLDGKKLYFVELFTLPTADGGDLTTILAEQSTFRASANGSGIRYSERSSFHTLWNGLSIAVDPRDLGKLRRLSGLVELRGGVSSEMDRSGDSLKLIYAGYVRARRSGKRDTDICSFAIGDKRPLPIGALVADKAQFTV